ncbi:MAG: hypothetical protein RI560_10535, partial [Natronomonas sp.]|nr:hypothetical protein [Natronomonas sp.]
MNPNTRLIAVSLSALLMLSALGPGLAMADAASASGNLSINVAQNDGVLVTVSDDDGGVTNASVNVTVDDANTTYGGAGTYTTDENGTVGLPTPDET